MCQVFSGQEPGSYRPVTRRLRLNGHSTSIRLEARFWTALDRMASREGVATAAFLSRLHDEVLEARGEASNFASLLRCACLIDAERASAARPLPYALAAE